MLSRVGNGMRGEERGEDFEVSLRVSIESMGVGGIATSVESRYKVN